MCIHSPSRSQKRCCCLATQDVQVGCRGQLQCDILQAHTAQNTFLGVPIYLVVITAWDLNLELLVVVVIVVSSQAGFK